MNTARTALLAVLGSAAIIFAAVAQPAATPQPKPAATSEVSGNLKSVLEAFRSDMNTAKIRTINQVMRMTGPEAEKFWPIYRRYEVELAALGDRRIALIQEFMKRQLADSFDDKVAADIADRWLVLAQERLDLWKKYHKEIATGVSPTRAAQFLQIEHQISLLIDINIASEMPLVGGTK